MNITIAINIAKYLFIFISIPFICFFIYYHKTILFKSVLLIIPEEILESFKIQKDLSIERSFFQLGKNLPVDNSIKIPLFLKILVFR